MPSCLGCPGPAPRSPPPSACHYLLLTYVAIFLGKLAEVAVKIVRFDAHPTHQGRSETFSFGGGTGGASCATRGAVNGLCRTFRKKPEKFWGATGGSGKIFGGQWLPLAPPYLRPCYSLVTRLGTTKA